MTQRQKTVENPPARKRGRPRKVINLRTVCTRLQGGEALRSVARSLMVTHSTILAHLRQAGLIRGFDY